MSETATAATGAGSAAEPEAEPWVVPASHAQERVWFASQFAGGSPVYHVEYRLRLPYPLDAAQIVKALNTVVERHESLRTSFRLDDGALMQVVHPVPAQLPVRVADGTIEELGAQLLHEPFRLDEAPLWRACLTRQGQEWVLLFVAHHTVLDAASCTNLAAELTALCEAAAHGRRAELPELPIQYADYAVWQRDRLRGGALDELEAFWRRALDGLPVVHGLPTDRPRPPVHDFAGAEVLFELPPGTAETLPAIARGAAATPFMVTLAAWVAALHRLSGRSDLVIGVPVAGRDLPELQPLIGMFVNMVVLRVPVTGEETFAGLVGKVRDVSLAAWDHQEMPFQRLVELFGARRDTAAAPLYQLGFNYLPTAVNSQSGTAEVDLMLELDGRRGRLEYATALFDESTAREIVDAFLRALTTGLERPEVALTELPVEPLVAAPAPSTQPPPPATTGPHEYVEPRTAAEELVATVWGEVLGAERVGATDDFFDLGGHSLLALRVIARLSAAIEVDLPIQAFFADTTVAGVAAEVERLLAAEIDALSEDEALNELGEHA
jgi:Condensation domain/Phosphopantetheine attachment site